MGEVRVYTYDDTPTGFGNLDEIAYPEDANAGDQDYDDYLYDSRGNLRELIDRKDVKVTFEYNKRRQVTEAKQWEDSTTAHTAETVYDQNGEVDYVLDAANRKTSYEYDALGNLLKVKKWPANIAVTVLENVYDERLLVKETYDGVRNKTTHSYFRNRQVEYVIDPLNRRTDFSYDEDLRLQTVRSPLARAALAAGPNHDPNYVATTGWNDRNWQSSMTDANQDSVDYLYDKDGRPKELANRLNEVFTWTYDDNLRKITTKTPLLRTTETILSPRGLPASYKEPSTDLTTFVTYDKEGRLLKKTDGVSGLTAGTTFTYWPNGLLKQISENGKTTYRAYDYANRLSRYEDGEAGNSGIDYTYYPTGELHTIKYPGNKTVTYSYDDFGRLWKVVDWSNRTTTYTYDNASRLTRLDRANGTYRIQEYDAASQLTAFREYKSGGALFVYQGMGYDADSRLENLFLHRRNNNGTVHALPAVFTLPPDNLTYDTDNQLSTWNDDSMSFDEDGNMTWGPFATAAAYDRGEYYYDSRNRLTGTGGSGYTYNPDGLRVAITGTGAATFVVDPNAALSRTLMRTKGGTTTYYVYGLGLLYEEVGGSTKTYHANQVGSTLAITDGAQNVTDWVEYAPFGTITHRSGTTDTPFLFNGEAGVQTEANGLYYMRARYYNPRLMRFVNADPIGFGGGLNWYAFGGNNPLQFLDPSGLDKVGRVTIHPLQILGVVDPSSSLSSSASVVKAHAIRTLSPDQVRAIESSFQPEKAIFDFKDDAAVASNPYLRALFEASGGAEWAVNIVQVGVKWGYTSAYTNYAATVKPDYSINIEGGKIGGINHPHPKGDDLFSTKDWATLTFGQALTQNTKFEVYLSTHDGKTYVLPHDWGASSKNVPEHAKVNDGIKGIILPRN